LVAYDWLSWAGNFDPLHNFLLFFNGLISTPKSKHFDSPKPFPAKGKKSRSGQSNQAACNAQNKPCDHPDKFTIASNAQTALMVHFI
jgi:hypothetical protein